VNASIGSVVPSQVNLHLRQSSDGWKWSAWRAHGAVDPVAGDDQVGLHGRVVDDIALEAQLDAQLAAARVEHLQQPAARHAAEAVAGRAHHLVAEVRLDVAPIPEQAADLAVGRFVGRLEVAESLVGEDHAEPEGVVGLVAFVHDDRGLGEGLLHQDGEVQAGRSAA
jgi:hypothetical protein